MLFTLDTSQDGILSLNVDGDLNIPIILVTLDTFQDGILLLNDDAD